MRCHYGLPSGTYTICISEEELQQLLGERKSLNCFVGRVPCFTSRLIWNSENKDMEVLDRKEIFHGLSMYIDEPVADIEPGYHHCQYLYITVEKKKEEK